MNYLHFTLKSTRSPSTGQRFRVVFIFLPTVRSAALSTCINVGAPLWPSRWSDSRASQLWSESHFLGKKKIYKNKRIKFPAGDSEVTSPSHLIPKVFSLLHQLYLHAHVPGLLALCPKQTAVEPSWCDETAATRTSFNAPKWLQMCGCAALRGGCEPLALGGKAASAAASTGDG